MQRSGGSPFKARLGKMVHETLSRKNLSQNKRGVGWWSGSSLEFKTQYHKTQKI
jgi:hypothetical protein